MRWGHAVVLPYTAVDDDFALLDAQRWQVAGRDDLDDLAGFLRGVVTRQTNGKRLLGLDDVQALVEVLGGRGLPQRDLIGDAAEREDEVERLSAEQAVILQRGPDAATGSRSGAAPAAGRPGSRWSRPVG